jgi:UDP-GlcNAc:undecaprenyl-phosphate/decaprenyl-phosphate GlcNAc-1-phosphate transferase
MVGGKRVDAKLMALLFLGVVVPAVGHRLLFAACLRMLNRKGMIRKNFRDEDVITGGGVAVFCYAAAAQAAMLLVCLIAAEASAMLRVGVLFLAGSASMAFWGWLDDCSPDKAVKGFRGHFGALWKERRMTSGMWKAWGGGSTALLVSLALYGETLSALAAAGLLALSPNVLNMFDLRPARALKVFALLAAVAVAGGAFASGKAPCWVWMVPVAAAAALVFRHDAAGRLMLGDTGANYLGFAAGFSLATNLSFAVQIAMLLVFAILHLLAEFVSFSRVIQSVGWLNRLDQWGRPAETK